MYEDNEDGSRPAEQPPAGPQEQSPTGPAAGADYPTTPQPGYWGPTPYRYSTQPSQFGQPGQPGPYGYSTQPSQFGQPGPYGYPSQPGQPTYDPHFWAPPEPPPSAAAKTRKHRRALVGSISAAAVTAAAVGIVATHVGNSNDSSTPTSATNPNSQLSPFSNGNGLGEGNNGGPDDSGSSGSRGGFGNGFGGDNGFGNGSGGSSSGQRAQATDTQQVGVVDIDTVLNFGSGKAAGTGIVLTSGGEILTNNHVVEGSTSIKVTIVSSGKQYTGTVVGTDPTDDIAVIQLKDASGLATANLGDSSKVAVGDAVTAVGNAGGVGGTPSAAAGTVTALNQSITASDGNGSNSEQLTGMIQVNANIKAGDSGGPLYNASDKVIGIDTAADTGRGGTGTTGFAIPIAKATSIADQIESGVETSTIHIGYPAFLGVQLSSTQAPGAGVAIGGVVDGSAAAKAGLVAGDSVTSVNGTAVTSSTQLAQVMAGLEPGQHVKLTWTDSSGSSHIATVTLGTGPAD